MMFELVIVAGSLAKLFFFPCLIGGGLVYLMAMEAEN